jgi:hypothetical protein
MTPHAFGAASSVLQPNGGITNSLMGVQIRQTGRTILGDGA